MIFRRIGALSGIAGALILASCFSQRERPDLLSQLAGCYVGSGELPDVVIRLERSGELSSGSLRTRFKVVQLKDGPALLPEKIIYSMTGFGDRLVTGGAGNFIPLSPDLQSFDLPFDSHYLTFTKAECPATLEAS